MAGTAKWINTLWTAGFVAPDCRQSVDSTPLVTVEKAKLATWKTELIEPGAEMLMLPSNMMYCSHSVSGCNAQTTTSTQACSDTVCQAA